MLGNFSKIQNKSEVGASDGNFSPNIVNKSIAGVSAGQILLVVQKSKAETSARQLFSNIQNKFEAGMNEGHIFSQFQKNSAAGTRAGHFFSESSKVQ